MNKLALNYSEEYRNNSMMKDNKNALHIGRPDHSLNRQSKKLVNLKLPK